MISYRGRLLLLFLALNAIPVHPQSSWMVLGDMPYAISSGEAVSTDSVIYIIGGYDSYAPDSQAIREFRPSLPYSQSSWRVIGQMQEFRENFYAVRFGDSIYCGGGIASWYDPHLEEIPIRGYPTRVQTDHEGFDSTFIRVSATAQVYNGILYIIGGIQLWGYHVPFIYGYDLYQGINVAHVDTLPLAGAMSAMIGDNIYIFGGSVSGVTKNIRIYNTTSGLYTTQPGISLLHPRAYGRAVHLGTGNRIMIIGGLDENNNALNTTEIFEVTGPNTDTIYPGPALNTARSNFMAAWFRNKVYIFGGHGLTEIMLSSVEITIDTVDDAVLEMPPKPLTGFALLQNYPNPFNPSTKISFSTPKTAEISLEVYSMLGEHITTLVAGKYFPGLHSVSWDGRSSTGQSVPSGVYFCRLRSLEFTASTKLLLLR